MSYIEVITLTFILAVSLSALGDATVNSLRLNSTLAARIKESREIYYPSIGRITSRACEKRTFTENLSIVSCKEKSTGPTEKQSGPYITYGEP